MLPLGQIGNPMQRFIYGEPYIDISFSTIVKYQEDTDENTIRTQILNLSIQNIKNFQQHSYLILIMFWVFDYPNYVK